MKFRKLLVMSACVACGLSLAACDGGKKDPSATDSQAPATKVSANVGLGYQASFNGTSQVDLTGAVVAFDQAGKVLDARIDVVQVKFAANDAKDALTMTNTNLNEDGTVQTKLELGTNYNMVKFGGAVAEVDVQIEAFADWTRGKTIAEIKAATEMKPHGDEEAAYLKEGTLATCTIAVGDFVAAYESAWSLKNATAVELPNTYTVGIALGASVSKKEVAVNVSGVVVSDKKVVAAAIDAVCVDFTIDAESGALALDTAAKYYDAEKTSKSKKVLGDAYAMAGKNGGNPACTLEWYEQAAIVEAGVVGKTESEIAALVKNEGALAGATITVSGFVSGLAKAVKYADLEHVGPQA